MDEYTKQIIHYMNNQKFSGTLTNYTQRIYHKSKICGDIVILYVVIENNKFKDFKYEFNGCALNTASFEIFCNYLLGKEVEEINNLNQSRIKETLGQWPATKNHCIDLALEVFNMIEK